MFHWGMPQWNILGSVFKNCFSISHSVALTGELYYLTPIHEPVKDGGCKDFIVESLGPTTVH